MKESRDAENPAPAVIQMPRAQVIHDFISAVNQHPEFADILKQYGLEWSSSSKEEQSAVTDDDFAGEELTPRVCNLDSGECESCT